LEKIGQQIAGGGYGDIWKGLLCGQYVSVKMMRISGSDNIKSVLKVRFSTLPFDATNCSVRHLCRNLVEKRSFGANSVTQTCFRSLAFITWKAGSV
jgi:hypothetical protein